VLNEKFGSHNRKIFNRFTTKESSCPSNITHYTKVLLSENRNLSGGDHRWFKKSTGEKRLVTGDMMMIVKIFLSPQVIFQKITVSQA
jgi:hypothetical protein